MPSRAAEVYCPECGCNASAIICSASNWGKAFNKMECDHCGNTWTVEAIVAKTAKPPPSSSADYKTATPGGATCPKCSRYPSPVTKTMPNDGGPRVRYHTCTCGHNFKSVESAR